MNTSGSVTSHVRILHHLDRAGRIICLTFGGALGLGYAVLDARPVDAWAFWAAGHGSEMYGAVWSMTALYVYPPPLAQIASIVPWPLFIAVWMPLIFWSLWYSMRWLSGPVIAAGIVSSVVGLDVKGMLLAPLALAIVGNPHAVVAAALVAGFTRPAAYAFPMLTKLAPGIGLLWFAMRREWRRLAVATTVTAVVAALSVLADPDAWRDWVQFAANNWDAAPPVMMVGIPAVVRIPMSIAVIWWGARTNRRWTVLVGAGWAALALSEWSFLTLWLAAVPLVQWSKLRRGGDREKTQSEGANTQPSGPA